MALAAYAAVASTLVVYLRMANARCERRWREGERTIGLAIDAAIHHLPPARPSRVVPDARGEIGKRVIRWVEDDGREREVTMHLGCVEIDWDGHRRDMVRNLLTAARKSVHIK